MAYRILIIEDERYAAERLDATIAELGYEIAGIAKSTEEALQLAKQIGPDLALLNIDLRGHGEGFKVSGKLRDQLHLPVIFLSTSPDREILRRACLSGCFGYLVKPLRPSELDAAMRIALDQHFNARRAFARFSWLTSILDSLSDGVIATGEDGTVQYLNHAAQVLTGWMPMEAIGKPIAEVYRLLDPDTKLRLRECQVHKALKTRAPTGKQRFVLIDRCGARIPIEDSASPILDGDTLLGAVTIFVNISGRIAAEEAESQQQDRLRNEIEASHLALARSNDDLLSLTARLIDAQEEERRRIARELHDDLAQRAAFMGQHVEQLTSRSESMPAGMLADIELLTSMISDLSAGLHEVSHRLHPSIIADLGLPSALGSLVADFRKAGLDLTISIRNVPDTIPLSVATAFYRIAQEALRNTLQHAPGAPARISLTSAGDELQLRIEDAGPGFSLIQAEARSGLGLLSMEERARIVGGSFILRTKPESGTAIEVTAPLKSEDRTGTNPARPGPSPEERSHRFGSVTGK